MLETILIALKLLLAFTTLSFVIAKILLARIRGTRNDDCKSVCVIVLGDIGRSPRMNYHCLSLANAGYHVKFIGYKESKPMEQILENEKIEIIPLQTYPKFLQIGPRILQYFLKVGFLSLVLFISLIKIRPVPQFLLIQNPPSIPTLALAYLYAIIMDSKLIVDWHNYGFSILALTNGPQNILVKICKKMEIFFGQKSFANLCVTNAMRTDLAQSYNIKANTLYDKPHETFQPLSINAKHEFYLKLVQKYQLKEFCDSSNKETNTAFTEVKADGKISLKNNRPALIVSSSSWTEDEDFHILIEALEKYQSLKDSTSNLPNLICVLTGKGPLKDYYMNLFNAKKFENIKVLFVWLDAGDYPLLLGAADLGISLHMSSSNLDLPMKVVDMFGTCLPVCAWNFKCISELVKNDEYGRLFDNSTQLSDQIQELLKNLNENKCLGLYRKNLHKFQERRWKDEWSSVMTKLIE